MFEQPVGERQCVACLDSLAMSAFRFDVGKMRYRTKCRHCESDESMDRQRKRAIAAMCAPWPECDLEVLRANYTSGGTGVCGALLPHRSVAAIRAAAKREGLRYEGPTVCGSKPKDDFFGIPVHDYTPADIAVMRTRLPVFGGGFGAARIGG